jgi:dipeptidyl-peptidase-4
VRDSNLFVVSSQGGEARRLTSEGDATHLFGRLDWVYQEEIYGRGNFQANWWSPDSERLAFLALDESAVPEYTIVDTAQRRPVVEKWRYPKVGDPNPTARLGVVDVRGGKARYFDLEGYPKDVLIVRVGWSPDSREVIAQLQDRAQTWLDLVAGDPSTGKLRRLFRDSSAAWTMPSDGPHWLEGNAEFVWLSERSGYRHMYLYRRDGALLRQVSEGPWEVDQLQRIDSSSRSVLFSADRSDVKGSQLFQVALDAGEPRQITREAGTHTVSVAPDGAFFVDSFASHKSAPRQSLYTAAGEFVRELARVDESKLAQYGLVPPEFFKLHTRDGFELEARLYKPADFDRTRKYPLLCFTYSGPHAPQVRDTFYDLRGLYHQMLAQQGILVWVCDNRSASGKGLVSAAAAYKRFGPGELADLEDGLDFVLAKGFVDPQRIGIWGWSYGGYMTAFALTHSKRFKLGISGAPVTDFRLYDSIYTERYMGLPDENKAGYDAGSPLLAAAALSGRLLLICGEIAENVHAQNTLQFAAALQKAGIQFDLMIYPGNRHSIVEPEQRRHLYNLMADYLLEHL